MKDLFRSIALTILLLASALAYADESSGRRYGSDGQYSGRYRVSEDSKVVRLYDKDGNFEGKIVRRDSDSWVRYSADGDYEGTLQEDGD